MEKRVRAFVHDVIAHPVCGLLWLVGAETLGNWLHDATVHPSMYNDEEWSRPRNS